MAMGRGEPSEAEKNLLTAAKEGTTEDVKRILQGPTVKVDCLDENGMTPLQAAAYRGNCEVARLLLAHGADVNNSEHEHGYSALMFAALTGKIDITQLMLEAGAKVSHTNSVGRNAAQMAAFVGQHQVVSLINNFFSREDLAYYTVPRGLEKEPKLSPELAPVLYKMILSSNLNPVGLSLYLKDNPELLNQGNSIARLLELLCEKMMKRSDTNEVMAIKFHYMAEIVRQCYQAPSIDTWIKSLIKVREEDGFTEMQEKFIRSTLKGFPYIESQLFQQLVRNIAPVAIGNDPTALAMLQQAVNGQRYAAADTEFCETCGEIGAPKKCSACKAVKYCNQRCQKLHWPNHKKMCPKLAVLLKEQELQKEEEERKQKEMKEQKQLQEQEHKEPGQQEQEQQEEQEQGQQEQEQQEQGQQEQGQQEQ